MPESAAELRTRARHIRALAKKQKQLAKRFLAHAADLDRQADELMKRQQTTGEKAGPEQRAD